MKDEIDIADITTLEELQIRVDDYIDYYNNDRYQWDLSKCSPSEYYQKYYIK